MVFDKIDQAGIAFQEIFDKRDNLVKDAIETHVSGHQAADPLEKPKLLFGAFKARFKFTNFGHFVYYHRRGAHMKAGPKWRKFGIS